MHLFEVQLVEGEGSKSWLSSPLSGCQHLCPSPPNFRLVTKSLWGLLRYYYGYKRHRTNSKVHLISIWSWENYCNAMLEKKKIGAQKVKYNIENHLAFQIKM